MSIRLDHLAILTTLIAGALPTMAWSDDVPSPDQSPATLSGARFFLEWTEGGTLRAGEVDDGEGSFAGGHKRAPVEKASLHTQCHIVNLGRQLLEREGATLPQWLQRAVWGVLGEGGPGATKRRLRGV